MYHYTNKSCVEFCKIYVIKYVNSQLLLTDLKRSTSCWNPVNLCYYICMYMCRYAYMYCMYVCMYARIDNYMIVKLICTDRTE